MSEWPLVLSGSADSTVRVWSAPLTDAWNFKCSCVLEGHQDSVNCLAVCHARGIFASGSSDGSVRTWYVSASDDRLETTLLCEIRFQPHFIPLALALHAAPELEELVLAAGGTKKDVSLYVSNGTGREFKFESVASLKGHEDWIRCLDFAKDVANEESDLILASASQDKYIRIWRLHRSGQQDSDLPQPTAPGSRLHSARMSSGAAKCVLSGKTYLATFEALLLGHEDGTRTAFWNSSRAQRRLLSASSDNSIAIWEADPTSGIWTCIARLGDVSVQKGATTATGSFGGLWVALWGPHGTSVTALGRTGSWRRWFYDGKQNEWVQESGISGHFKGVSALAWAKDGRYLVSTSLDQTTRLHACLAQVSKTSWHEVARAQIHGYDLACIDTLKTDSFVSGAEEKLLRVFNEPRSTSSLIACLARGNLDGGHGLAPVAAMSTLGLSNKTIDSHVEEDVQLNGVSANTGPQNSEGNGGLPTEDFLARHTLWPETDKLYGHGSEISAVAASHDDSVIASACRSSSLEHSAIRLYETETWREIKPPLESHSLTVNSLCFSEDDKYLLSAGRDRQHVVFRREDDGSSTYRTFSVKEKSHSRMLLDASWAPFRGKRVFATAGRDKLVKVWELIGDLSDIRTTINARGPVQSIDFHSQVLHERMLLAYSTENGEISICTIDNASLSVMETRIVEQRYGPTEHVSAQENAYSKSRIPSSVAFTSVTWQPRVSPEGSLDHPSRIRGLTRLAAGCDDGSIKIFACAFTQLFEP